MLPPAPSHLTYPRAYTHHDNRHLAYFGSLAPSRTSAPTPYAPWSHTPQQHPAQYAYDLAQGTTYVSPTSLSAPIAGGHLDTSVQPIASYDTALDAARHIDDAGHGEAALAALAGVPLPAYRHLYMLVSEMHHRSVMAMVQQYDLRAALPPPQIHSPPCVTGPFASSSMPESSTSGIQLVQPQPLRHLDGVAHDLTLGLADAQTELVAHAAPPPIMINHLAQAETNYGTRSYLPAAHAPVVRPVFPSTTAPASSVSFNAHVTDSWPYIARAPLDTAFTRAPLSVASPPAPLDVASPPAPLGVASAVPTTTPMPESPSEAPESPSSARPPSPPSDGGVKRREKKKLESPFSDGGVKRRDKKKHESPPSDGGVKRQERRRPEQRKPRVLACDFCRGRKIECSGPDDSFPDRQCNPCIKRGLTCVYSPRQTPAQRRARSPFADSPVERCLSSDE